MEGHWIEAHGHVVKIDCSMEVEVSGQQVGGEVGRCEVERGYVEV